MKPITVLFFGSQGAGKGTQVKMLLDFLRSKSEQGIIHIDMGQVMRDLRDTGSFTGKLVGAVHDAGIRLPDFMAIYLQTGKLADGLKTGEEHIVGDGLARGSEQAAALHEAIRFFKRDNLRVINLIVSDDMAVQRLLARGRVDDTEEGIRSRLGWYKSDVIPQLEFLRTQGWEVIDIGGELDEQTIHQNILKALGLV